MRNATTKRMMKLTLIAALLVIISSQVLGIGIGPSRQYISFAPGQEIEGELVIINDGKDDFRAGVYAQGDLSQYITIGTPLVDVSPSETMKRVPYKIKFPTTSPKPGEHRMEIVVRQFPPDTEIDEGTVISANIALISQIIVKVPYPGKFAEGKLFIGGGEKNDTPTRFTLMLYNFGTEDIQNAYAKVEVFNPAMEKVTELYSNNQTAKSKEEVKLEAVWHPKVAKGTYKAAVTVYYDNKEFRIDQDFNIGIFTIDVSDISVKKFRLGDVAKFDILLYNSWNTEIKDVYVEMVVEDSTGKKMTESKTAAVDIPVQQAKQVEAYWYTEGVMPGVYRVKLIVHYAGKITQKEYDFEVDTNSITRLGTVGQAITAEEKEEITSQGLIIMLILIVLVLLIGMNIVWFYFLSKQMKKKGGEK